MRYTISFLMAILLAPGMLRAEGLRVVTDIAPVGSLVAQVMGDLGTPQVLLDQGADAHSFQLRPSQAGALAEADLVVWIGPEMTPWLDRSLAALGAAPQLRLVTTPGTKVRGFGEAGHHDQAESDGRDDHAPTGTDPHAWLDPAKAQVWVAAIAAELSQRDPANAAAYAANATAASAGIAALNAEVGAILAPAAAMPLIVHHDAYGYFAAQYGLTLAGALAEGDAAPPGAAHLGALQAAMAQPSCVFPEANHDPKALLALIEGTRARIGGVLDPEGSSLPPGPALYGDLLRGLARTIAACAEG